MTSKKWIVVLSLTLTLTLTGLLVTWAYRSLFTPVVFSQSPVEFEIKTGRSLFSVTKALHASDLISSPCALTLSLYGYLSGQAPLIKAGEYRLLSGQTPVEILKQFVDGRVIQHAFTIVEGWTVSDLLHALAKETKLKHELQDINSDELLVNMGLEAQSAEGLFFADTYYFVRSDTDVSILKRSHDRMEDELKKAWVKRANGLPLTQPYEALILASIVEKETGVPEERAEIAGVFVRRLQKGMLLQTDPAVIYGLKNNFDGNLTRQHLQTDTPYNTYLHLGLPPTPIALPGRDALHASLHPKEADSLYFVAKGDGRHYFSATLEEHSIAVKKYQLQRKEDYHSAPAVRH